MANKSKRKQSNVNKQRALKVEPKRPPPNICLACRERGRKMLDELAKGRPAEDTKINGKDRKIRRHY